MNEVAKSIKDINNEKVLTSLKDYGNTSSASIPLTLCANTDILKKKDRVCLHMCGFGVGLAWGNIYLELETDCIYPILESDEYYDVATGEVKKDD